MLSHDDPRFYDPSFDNAGNPVEGGSEPDPDEAYERAYWREKDEESE